MWVIFQIITEEAVEAARRLSVFTFTFVFYPLPIVSFIVISNKMLSTEDLISLLGIQDR